MFNKYSNLFLISTDGFKTYKDVSKYTAYKTSRDIRRYERDILKEVGKYIAARDITRYS